MDGGIRQSDGIRREGGKRRTRRTEGDERDKRDSWRYGEYQGEQSDYKICSFEDKQLDDRGEDRLRLEQMIVNVK